jgi:hypothetical protein
LKNFTARGFAPPGIKAAKFNSDLVDGDSTGVFGGRRNHSGILDELLALDDVAMP